MTPTYLEIVFECASKIENPTLCFRKYSKFLIDTFQLEDWATASGNFLRGIESKEISENEALGNIKESEKKDEEISDLEMLKQILDICFAYSVENAEERNDRELSTRLNYY